MKKILTPTNYELIPLNDKTNVRFFTSIDPGSYVAPHWHDAVEIVYLLEGELKVIVGNDSRILKADSGSLHGKIHSQCKKFMFQPSGSGSLTCSAEQSGAF